MDAPQPETPALQPEPPVLQPESPAQQALAPEAAMHDAAAPGPGLSPLVDSRQSSQAPPEPPQPRLPEGSLDGANGTQSPISVPSGSSHSTPGPQPPPPPPPTQSQPQPLSLPLPPLTQPQPQPLTQPVSHPLPPPSSTPVPAVASAAPPPQPGPPAVPHSQASSPRPSPVPGPVPTRISPVAGPYQGHHQQQQQPPPPLPPLPPPQQQQPVPVTHYQQPPPLAHHAPPPAHHGPLPPPAHHGPPPAQHGPPPAHHGPPQPLPVNGGHPPQPSPLQQGKVAIVEPPRPAHRASGPNNNALHSPGRDHARTNPKFNEDISRLTHAIQQSLPEAVRHVTREHWEKTLLGSDYHQNFVMSAGFLHSNAIALQHAVGDNGHKMVFHAKRELVQHFAAADLDAVADNILAKASDQFLDKALEIRLATIDARSLINALARNGRLGYESGEGDGNTAPSPAHAPAPHPQPAYPHPPAHAAHMPAQVQPNTMPTSTQSTGTHLRRLQPQLGGPGSGAQQPMQCGLCWRKFQSSSALEYHTKKRVCTKTPPDANGFPFNCPFCGTGFVTSVGKNYHQMNKVCGDHGMAPATPRAPASPITLSSGTSSPVRHMPSAATPNTAPRTSQAVPAASMSQPAHRSSPYQTSPGQASTPVSSQRFSSDDPYSHLRPTTRQKLEEELRQAELSYRPRFEEVANIADANERLRKQEGLQNSFSTKQSIIRKKYGVRLRQRRTRAEIDAERERVTGNSTTFSRKRQRTDSETPSGPLPVPTPHLAVADMNSAGLGGSGATAAMADPTVDQTPPAVPRHSLASYQRNGYRVSTHVPVGSRLSSSHHQDVPMADASTEVESRTQSPDPKMGSTADPIVLDASSSESESDADEDIPATLPPGMAPSASSARGLAG